MTNAIPTHISFVPEDTDLTSAQVGSALLGLPLFEQGLNVARVLEAKDADGLPLYPTTVILLPRRSQKTTSIWAVLLGRMTLIPDYKVVTTAQNGQLARNKFREHARMLAANGWDDEGTGNTIRWANGSEAFEFANGSRLWVVAPNAASFRSEAADTMLFDEAGEYDPEKSEDLLSGALPLMDTRPQGQVIIAGTPAKSRAGLLWDTLQEGRAGEPGTGIVDYSIRDSEASVIYPDDDESAVPILNVEVFKRVHPGVGTLTTMVKMQQRFTKMQLPQFEREYLCRFPTNSTTLAIDPEKWHNGETEASERPDRVGMAFDCAYDGSSASLAYAWRDADGNAVIEVVAHRLGTSWLARVAHKAQQDHKRYAVAYDGIGANFDPVNAMLTMKPTPKTQRLTMNDILGAAQRITSEIDNGTLRHFGQSDLEAAVANASWRNVAKSGRAFGVKDNSGGAINPIVAASLALWQYDKTKERVPISIAM